MESSAGHNWEFFGSDTKAIWDAMLLSIRAAKKSIDLEQFIFANDDIGKEFAFALIEKAKAGVKIRMFCDHIGSYSLSGSPTAKALENAGVKIKIFNSIVPWSPNNEALWYFRDHRKLLIVDSQTAFVGGMCIGDEMYTWRESAVRIEGSVVKEIISSFDMMWDKTYHRLKFYLKRRSKAPASDFRYIANSPLPDKHYLYKELIRAIKASKHYIYLTTPYLLPDSRLLRNLKRATKRGVEVRILVPHTTNYKILDVGMDTFYEDLIDAGVRIFRFNVSQFIHAKTGVIDGSWSTIGSMNLDNLSLRYNFEGNIVSYDKKFAFGIEKMFMDDIKNSTELTAEAWKKRPAYRKLLELLVWPIRKFL